jgi:uncharacterized glyoxalase superfamily protein PhnB
VPEAVEWLCNGFAFEKHRVVSGDDGEILYAHLTFGDHLIMVLPVRASDLASFIKQPYEVGGAETQSNYIVVDDADAHFRNAKAAGASIVLDIKNDEHGGRGYACRDPEGHIWSFGTYDPWQAAPVVEERSSGRGVVMAAALAGVAVVAATAGWMLPRPAALKADGTRLQNEASAARERAGKEEARASSLATELAQEKSAKDAAERAAREAREQLAREQGAKKTAETGAQQLKAHLAEVRRVSDAAEQKAREAREQIAAERSAREAAQRSVSDATKELTRERDAKQRAERSAQDALEKLAREQRAREDAERAAKEARDQLVQVAGEKSGVKPQAGSTQEPERNP